jgi:hypothetical protein
MSLLNTNGTAQFMDSAGTNSGGRFYRAVLPYSPRARQSGTSPNTRLAATTSPAGVAVLSSHLSAAFSARTNPQKLPRTSA